MTALDFLPSSRKQLRDITKSSYNAEIRPVALAFWDKHVRAENPVWRYVTAKSFSINNENGSGHVIAMVDKRLPSIGIVGFFASTDSYTGAEVLTQASDWLKQEFGLSDIYGPINGTLPTDYRLNLADDYQIPGEPVNPIWHIDAFKDAGFKVFNRYASGSSKHYQLFTKLLFFRKPSKGYAHISVRPFNVKNQNQDFKVYHDLRNAIFPHQSIYCPAISLEERLFNIGRKEPLLNPQYTYFLEDRGRAIGFIMGYPYEGKLIIKTIGLLPDYRGKRLSGLLVRQVHNQAKKDGLTAAVYAMVRVGNRIYQMKRPGVKVFREYVTMHKSI